MTTAIGTRDPAETYAAYYHDDLISAVESINGFGCRRDTIRGELKPHWRPTEEEIVRAAITVISVSLMTLIGLGAGAFLTMG